MEVKGRKKVYDGFFKMYELSVEQDGKTFTREQFDRGTAVAALVHDTAKDSYILTRQFRIGSESELIEVVAGMVDAGEYPEESIKREIVEEIGYHVDKLEHLYTFYSSPGGTTEKVLLYFAEVSKQHADGGGNEEEHEMIEIVEFSEREFLQLQTPDAKTIIAQLWLQLNQKR